MTSAGSPGSRCCSEKIRLDTKNSVGMICAMRLARKVSMAGASRAAGRDDVCQQVETASFPPPLWRRESCQLGPQQCISTIYSLQLQPGHAHQPVGYRLVALQLLGIREQEFAVVEIDDRIVLEHDPGQLLVKRLALQDDNRQPDNNQQQVGFRVGIAAVVLRCTGVQ